VIVGHSDDPFASVRLASRAIAVPWTSGGKSGGGSDEGDCTNIVAKVAGAVVEKLLGRFAKNLDRNVVWGGISWGEGGGE